VTLTFDLLTLNLHWMFGDRTLYQIWWQFLQFNALRIFEYFYADGKSRL